MKLRKGLRKTREKLKKVRKKEDKGKRKKILKTQIVKSLMNNRRPIIHSVSRRWFHGSKKTNRKKKK